MSADERRQCAIRAAMAEFARGGLDGTSTEVIAKRVGVSQPYLFRLFPSKRALFLAAARHCFETFTQIMAEAADGKTGRDAIVAMGQAYRQVLEKEPELLQFQLQVQSAALMDAEIRQLAHDLWAELWRTVTVLSAEEPAEVTHFIAIGMLLNVLTAYGVPYVPGEQLPESLHAWAFTT
jgi:AcrR family transcriptional regulator